jgi:hypothetical protein
MNHRAKRSWNGIVLWLVLLWLCAFCYGLALLRMEFRHAFALLDERAIRRMALIDFVHAHPELTAGYALIFLAAILQGVWRRHPRWARHAAFAGFAAPCIVYLCVCAQISQKIVLWR